MEDIPRDLFFRELIYACIEDPTTHFQERPWLTGQITSTLEKPDCRFLLVLGEPGSGKSVLQAWLASQHSDWPRYFIRRDSQHPLRSGDVHSFLFAIGHQLAVRRPQLFDPGDVKIVAEQRISKAEHGAKATGIIIGELIASPFFKTSLQIYQDVEINAGELVGLNIGRFTPETRLIEVENLQYLALLDPAELLFRLDPQEQLVVLVDALDELRFNRSQYNLLNWLADLPELPDNLRFVLTSRPDDDLLADFRQKQSQWLDEIKIDPDSNEVLTDLHAYTLEFSASPAIQKQLKTQGTELDRFTQVVVSKAEGNFLYVALLRRAIEQAIDDGDQNALLGLMTAETIPDGLKGLYAQFLIRLRSQVGETLVETEGESPFETRSQPAWEALYQPILGVLATAFETLEPDQLQNLAKLQVEERFIQSALQRLEQFLEQRAGRISLFHSTLAEFLTSLDTRQSHPALYLDPSEWHRKIASAYRQGAASWNEVAWKQVDQYGLLHLPRHLQALASDSRYREEFYGVFCQAFVREKRLRFGSYALVHRDLTMAVQTALSGKLPELPELVRLILLRAILSEITSDLPEQMITALLRIGESEQALGAAALIQAPEERARIYEELLQLLIKSGQETEAEQVLVLSAATAWQYLYESMAITTVTHNDIAAYLAKPAVAAAQAGKLTEYFQAYQQAGGYLDPYLLALLADQMAQRLSGEGAVQTVHLAIDNLDKWDLSEDTRFFMLAFAARALARMDEKAESGELINEANEFAQQNSGTGLDVVLAPAIALNGDLDQAKKLTLDNLSYSESQEALLILAKVLAKDGRVQEAQELAGYAEDDDHKDAILGGIILILAEQGDDSMAVQTAEQITYGDRYAESLRQLATIQAYTHRYTAALESIRSLEKTHQKSVLPLTLSEQLQGVLAEIRTDVPDLQSSLLRVLAGVVQEKKEPAPELFSLSELDTFMDSEDIRVQTAASGLAAITVLSSGDLEKARSIYASMPGGYDRTGVLSAFVYHLVANGAEDEARLLMRQEQDLTQYGRALFSAELALALHAAGRIKEAQAEMQTALRLLEELPASEQAVLGLCAIAGELFSLNISQPVRQLLDLGKRMCEKLEDTVRYVRCSSSLSQIYSQAGLPEQALDLINQISSVRISDVGTQAQALRYLLPAATAAQDPALTRRLVGIFFQVMKQLKEPLEQAEILAVIVSCLADIGDFKLAMELVGELENPLYKLQALGDLLFQIGPRDHRDVADQAAEAAGQQIQEGIGMWEYHGKQFHVYKEDIVQKLSEIAANNRLETLVYSRLACGLENAGYSALAGQAFHQALDLGNSITGPAEGTAVLADLTRTANRLGQQLASKGLAEQALELAHKAEDWETYAFGLSSAAKAFQANGEAGLAEELTLEAWASLAHTGLVGRESLYQLLQRSISILAAIDRGETLENISRRIEEVEQWWLEGWAREEAEFPDR